MILGMTSTTSKDDKPESTAKKEQFLQKSVEDIMARVRRAEVRITSLESELSVLDERLKTASDMLAPTNKLFNADSGSIVSKKKRKIKRMGSDDAASSSAGPKKSRISRGSKPLIKLPRVPESEEVTKIVNRNIMIQPESSDDWNKTVMNDLIKFKDKLAQVSSASGKSYISAPSTGKSKYSSKTSDIKLKKSGITKKTSKGHTKGKLKKKGSKQTDELIDPKTGRRFLHPVRNIWCMHIYEREEIKNLIDAKRDVMCPHPGCSNNIPVRVTDLADIGNKSGSSALLGSSHNYLRRSTTVALT